MLWKTSELLTSCLCSVQMRPPSLSLIRATTPAWCRSQWARATWPRRRSSGTFIALCRITPLSKTPPASQRSGVSWLPMLIATQRSDTVRSAFGQFVGAAAQVVVNRCAYIWISSCSCSVKWEWNVVRNIIRYTKKSNVLYTEMFVIFLDLYLVHLTS